MASPLPDDCAERFTWKRALASGGFGSVHVALHRALEREVAVKVCRRTSRPIASRSAVS